MQEIECIQDIQFLLVQGFSDWQAMGQVNVSTKDNLHLFNYKTKAQIEGRWNFFERVSRGLILDVVTGEIVARPFDKFFNWNQDGRCSNAQIVSVTEKLDGSLGILYRHAREGYCIATRGSFYSKQAEWATEFLRDRYFLNGLSDRLTLLFEIIYPGNRIIVDYGSREDLVLLAARWCDTGQYFSFERLQTLAATYGFSLPKTYRFETPEQLLNAARALDRNSEGWVVEFADGQRFKFKGEDYCQLNRLLAKISFKNTLEHLAEGKIEALRASIPDDFLTEVNAWVEEIETRVSVVCSTVEAIFNQAPRNDRKTFALWVKTHHQDLAPYLFARLDNRPLEPLVYKELKSSGS